MNIKGFLRSLSWLVVLNVLVKPVWVFGIDRKAQLIVGHESFGAYFSILNLSIILSIVADAGLTNLLNRELALGNHLSVSRLAKAKLALSVAYLAVLLFVGWISGIVQWDLLLLTGLLQVAQSYLVFYRNVVTGRQLFRADAWLSISDKSLIILVCGLFLYTPLASSFSLRTFLLIQLGANCIAIAVAALIAARRKPGVTPGEGKLSGLFRLSAPFLLVILLMSVHTRLDAFLLERIHPQGALQAGIYAAAYRLLDAGNTAGYLTASFLVPFAARHLHDKKLIDDTVLRLRHFLLLAAMGFAGLCAGLAPLVMQLLYHSTDQYSANVLVACVAALPAYYGIHLYGSLLNASGRLGLFASVVAGCALVNGVLNMLLIPRWGALGCCWAAVASQYLCAIACYLGARPMFGLRLRPLSVIAYCLLGSMVYGACKTALGTDMGAAFWILNAAIAATLIMFAFINSMRPKRNSIRQTP
ncbi:MAG: hypothetical protein EOO08_00195 [Chitinophagaceae bacterium]|nr:MAG: hypothetical protein EOO08_00195 [Chitinophagaceae bacterium]